MRRASRILLVSAAVVGVGVLAFVTYVGVTAWASVPKLDGAARVQGLANQVVVASDGFGIPTITARSRTDAFRALGHVTARDRLFQMDLLRRSSAGRLAEIFGADVLELDKQRRILGLGRAARAILAQLPAAQREVLEAYADGVNSLIGSVGLLPLEFRVLRYRPEPWSAADSLLVALGMFEVLTGSDEYERSRSVLEGCVSPELKSFLLPETDRYTRALFGARAEKPGAAPAEALAALVPRASVLGMAPPLALSASAGEAPRGSNAWAVAGTRTRDGRAILANDMHLDLGVPNVWYRAELRYGDTFLGGVVLPGLPVVVAGSNQHVAWGITSLEGDTLDLVALELHPDRPGEYRTLTGWKRMEQEQETIAVRDSAPVVITVRRTIWGPVAARPLGRQTVAIRWAALDPSAVDLGMLEMDRSRNVDEGVAIMNRAGGPASNVVLADRGGRVAWTIMGRIPRRRGFDGATSVSWANDLSGWQGYLTPGELPRIVDPATGFIVSANHRMLPGKESSALGRDFASGYRAFRISERLRGATAVDEMDMFQLQLDTRAEFFEFYRKLALGVLTERAVAGRAELGEARRVFKEWDGRAEPTSAGMGLLVCFRRALAEDLFPRWLGACRVADPGFELRLADIDTPVQMVLGTRPAALAPAAAWDGFVVAALERAIVELRRRHGEAAVSLPWGEVSRVKIAHPLGDAIPGLGRLLNMPPVPLPGCGFCVRVAAGSFGASERLVVSPGREADGVLHMPAGQSGHPLSRHYADQQPAWVAGRPLPFLASPAVATLELTPVGTSPSAVSLER